MCNPRPKRNQLGFSWNETPCRRSGPQVCARITRLHILSNEQSQRAVRSPEIASLLQPSNMRRRSNGTKLLWRQHSSHVERLAQGLSTATRPLHLPPDLGGLRCPKRISNPGRSVGSQLSAWCSMQPGPGQLNGRHPQKRGRTRGRAGSVRVVHVAAHQRPWCQAREARCVAPMPEAFLPL
jgi:hypothetical protein